MDAIPHVVQRFPLVARARPACPPLDQRIKEVAELARAAQANPNEPITRDPLPFAAAAHNKAALIASDCGIPDLARSLCWQHAEIYLEALPLTAHVARLALEPLVNLARLEIRNGNPDSAYRILNTLYRGVADHSDTAIDGKTFDFSDFVSCGSDHREIVQWLWTVLLADGTRALTTAGRWDAALQHIEQHKGIGERLLDGRQVAIVAHLLKENPEAALALISDSVTSEPWEQAVASCMTMLCLRSSDQAADSARAANDMIRNYLALEPIPGLIVFRTRLGLAVRDLTPDADQQPVMNHIIHGALASGDGYASQAVLTDPACREALSATNHRALSEATHSAGLGRHSLPPHLMTDLQMATHWFYE